MEDVCGLESTGSSGADKAYMGASGIYYRGELLYWAKNEDIGEVIIGSLEDKLDITGNRELMNSGDFTPWEQVKEELGL